MSTFPVLCDEVSIDEVLIEKLQIEDVFYEESEESEEFEEEFENFEDDTDADQHAMLIRSQVNRPIGNTIYQMLRKFDHGALLDSIFDIDIQGEYVDEDYYESKYGDCDYFNYAELDDYIDYDDR